VPILGKNKDWLPNDQLTTEMHLTVLTTFPALSKVSLLNQLQWNGPYIQTNKEKLVTWPLKSS
jgi:hypothetical protein